MRERIDRFGRFYFGLGAEELLILAAALGLLVIQGPTGAQLVGVAGLASMYAVLGVGCRDGMLSRWRVVMAFIVLPVLTVGAQSLVAGA